MSLHLLGECRECGRMERLRDHLCFRCRIKTVGFTFNGAHTGKRGWHEDTVMGAKKEIYDGARAQKLDITRAP